SFREGEGVRDDQRYLCGWWPMKGSRRFACPDHTESSAVMAGRLERTQHRLGNAIPVNSNWGSGTAQNPAFWATTHSSRLDAMVDVKLNDGRARTQSPDRDDRT